VQYPITRASRLSDGLSGESTWQFVGLMCGC